MQLADRQEVVHNLCVQMNLRTLESVEEPERLGCVSGDWYVEGVDVRKRQEMQMVRLMAKLGTGIKLMMRPKWVDGVKLSQAADDLWAGTSREEAYDHTCDQAAEGRSQHRVEG